MTSDQDVRMEFEHGARCQGATRKGEQCKNSALPGSKYCALHAPQTGEGESARPPIRPPDHFPSTWKEWMDIHKRRGRGDYNIDDWGWDEEHGGLPIVIRSETGTLRVGDTEAPFAVADSGADKDIEPRIFVDKYLVEVFANDRRALVAAHMDRNTARGVRAYTFGAPLTIKSVELWPLTPVNRGFIEAEESRIWEPRTE